MLEKLVTECEPYIAGISAINTIPAHCMRKNSEYAFGEKRKKSGISGSVILPAGIKMTKALDKIRYKHSLSYSIIGIGGVQDYNSYLQYKNAGADVVMSATGSLYNPYLAQEIKNKIT
jgi:dihydroorotate dehydrogenase